MSVVSAATYLVGVVLFVIGLALSVGLHEFGHLVPGKLFDVKVTQYFIGFGRTLWSRQRGETEYGVKAIPLGGYVKLVGMLPPDPDADPELAPGTIRASKTGMFSQLVDDSRAAEYELVDEADHDRLLYAKPWWQRVIIMGCGVAINLVLAFLLFAIVFMGHGVDVLTTTVGRVYECVKVVKDGDQTTGECTAKDPETPAKKAGLRPGDRVIAYDGTTITSYDQLQHLIRAHGADPATLIVERHGKDEAVAVTPTVTGLPALDDSGKTVKVGYLGISPTTRTERKDLGYVVSTMSSGTWSTLTTIGHLPNRLYHVSRAALGLEKRSPDSPVSVVGAGRVAGELASQKGLSIGDKIASLLLLLAGLNLFVGLINLVPLPPFDGGQIASTLYETLRRWLARLRGRPDPGAFDTAKLLPITYAMAMLIVLVSVILIVADIVAPVSLS